MNTTDRFAAENFEHLTEPTGKTVEQLQERAKAFEAKAQRSIGKQFTVRQDRKNSVVGIIDKVEYCGHTLKAREAVGLLRVEMLCGKNKVRREFTVASVPV